MAAKILKSIGILWLICAALIAYYAYPYGVSDVFDPAEAISQLTLIAIFFIFGLTGLFRWKLKWLVLLPLPIFLYVSFFIIVGMLNKPSGPVLIGINYLPQDLIS